MLVYYNAHKLNNRKCYLLLTLMIAQAGLHLRVFGVVLDNACQMYA